MSRKATPNRRETIARPCENGHPIPVGEAARQLGISRKHTDRLAKRYGCVTRRGSRGRGKSMMVDLDALQRSLSGQSSKVGAQDAITSFSSRLLNQFANDLADAFHSGTLRSAISATTPAAARAAIYAWTAAALAVALELRRCGIEQPIPELPEKMDSLRSF